MTLSFTKYVISCSLFENISTNFKGSIISVIESEISISQVIFNDITSSTFPGVIFADFSNLSLFKTSFYLCFASGKNEKYGRTIYSTNSDIFISHFTACQCSPKVENVGDSTAFFNKCGNISCNNFNSSFCYGSDGSSGIGIWGNSKELSLLYLSITDSKDLFCFEATDGEEIHIINSNFINSTENDAVVNAITSITFVSCVFQLMPEKFQHHSGTHSNFLSCVSDEEIEGISFSTIVKSTRL